MKFYKISNIFTIITLFLSCFFTSSCNKENKSTDNNIKKLLISIQKDLGTTPEDKILSEKIDSLLTIKNLDSFKHINEYGKHLHYTGQQAKAVEFYSELAFFYQSQEKTTTQDYKNLINCYIPLGAAFEELGLKNMAMDYYMEGIEIADQHNFQSHKAMLLNNIGVIYFGIEDYDQALEYFTKASIINSKEKNKDELFINYNNIAEVYMKKNNLSKSMDYSLKALQYLDEQKDGAMYYMMHSNIGLTYTLRNDYPMAISYLNNAIVHQKELGLTTYLISSYLNIADVYIKTNNLDTANYFAQEALNLATEKENISLQIQTLLTQSSLAKIDKNYALSLELLEKADLLKDSIQQLDNKKKMENWEKIYELEKIHTINNSIIDKWDPKTILLIMIGIVTILICLIIILYLTNKNKDQKIERTKLSEIKHQKEQSERFAAEEEKNKEMQKEIDLQNRQLTTYTLEKIRFNELISDINSELKQVLLEINPRSKEHKERIQNLLNKLAQLDIHDNWQEFQYYFEQVHPCFYERLEAQFPSLTARDKRLCAFISLGLTTKEIATITFREVRSCESSRNRLRKKLGVSAEVDLTKFIGEITKI